MLEVPPRRVSRDEARESPLETAKGYVQLGGVLGLQAWVRGLWLGPVPGSPQLTRLVIEEGDRDSQD